MKIEQLYAYFPSGKSIIFITMRLAFLLFFTVSFGFTPFNGLSQNAKVNLKTDRTLTIDEIFDLIEEQTSYRFVYPSSLIKDLPEVDIKEGTITVKDLLESSFLNVPVVYEFRNKKNIVLTKERKDTNNEEEQQQTITGTVTDQNGVPLSGVNITVEGTSRGTQTDFDGNYEIEAEEGEVLRFSYVGFEDWTIGIGDDMEINVTMKGSASALDEVVLVGYGTERKVTQTGAISSLKGEKLVSTKTANPQNMLTGKIPGVRVWQKSAEPGDYNANFDIRGLGAPLVVIDGIPREMEDFQRLSPEDIEDISVLKDASASIYGVRSANGVVLVKTKQGKDGKMKVNYTGSYTVQKPIGLPRLANPAETMTLYNENAMNDINGGHWIYTEEDFLDFAEGKRRSGDWNSLIISDVAPQTTHDLSVSGGSEAVQYYFGGGYQYQEGVLKSRDLNYDKYNFRSNVDVKITSGLDLSVKLSGMSDHQNKPYTSTVDIIRNWWSQGVLFPAYADPEHTLLNYDGLALEQNTVAMMTSDISGFKKYRKKSFQSSVKLDLDLGSFSDALHGLNASALISYDFKNNDNSIYRREYNQYAFNENTGDYDQKLYDNSSPNQLRRESFNRKQILAQFFMNYNRTFNSNEVKATLGWEAQKNDNDNFYGKTDLAFSTPYLIAGMENGKKVGMSNNLNDFLEESKAALIGRINYAYKDKYLTELQFRYDGSSRFAKGHQWGFFPSLSLGWRISEESFFKSIDALTFIDNFKIRGSYGILGDDLAGSWDYEWLAGYIYPATSGNEEGGYYNQYAPGYIIDGDFVNAMERKAIPNESLSWYKSKMLNIGVDFDAWNEKLGVTFEYFNRRRSGMFERRNSELPTVMGTTAPLLNINSDEQYGYELQLSHKNNIGEFRYNLTGIATVTRNKFNQAVQNGPYENSYDRWRHDNLTNRFQGMQFGYESAGRFQDWEDIRSYPLYTERDVLPGDYKYKDWNGDGEINGLDEHPIAYDQTPWLNFSLNVEARYKNFDINLLFQGTGMGSMQYEEPLYSIWGDNGGGTLTQYLNRWHPKDPMADPYDPGIEWIEGYYGYTGNYPRANSEFNRVSTAYLRLKSLELGYTLSAINKASNMNLRFFLNAYNLFTITNVKFVDPEHPDDELGRLYPLTKNYTIGMTLSF